jgi:hypothetical protein
LRRRRHAGLRATCGRGRRSGWRRAKLERTQRILATRTETETIHRALDLVAEEAALLEALRDFVLTRGRIEDIDAWR